MVLLRLLLILAAFLLHDVHPSPLYKSFAVHLPNLTSHMNSTLGHSDSVMAYGLDPFPARGGLRGGSGDLSTEELLKIIPNSEMNSTIEDAAAIASQSQDEIKQAGWKLVHKGEYFSLYKRRSLPNNQGPVEYLMMGKIADVSPRTFLHAQINCECRRAWDKTMKEMIPGVLAPDSSQLIEGIEGSEDSIYYRTKWPWPLKDRDYTLARRCRIFEERKAMVFVSRSAEINKYARKDGVIRVDNYWCHSALFSSPELASSGTGSGSGSTAAGISPPKRLSLVERARARDAKKAAASSTSDSGSGSGGGGFFGKRGKVQAKDKGMESASSGSSTSCMDQLGVSFVSVFCDDQKVPLHPRIVDMIAHQVNLTLA